MADFATLVLNADSRGLVSGERALDSLATTAGRTEGRVVKANDNMARSTEQVGRQSVLAGQQSRMMAMQLSQVAQQASATGNWIQALAIQLPDLALGFGPIGIAAGVAAGAILPLAANLVMAEESADALEDAMDALKNATESYADAMDNASLSAIDLIDKFGSQAEAAGQVYEALRKIKELEFASAMREARDAISDSLSGIQESMERFDVATTMFGNPEAITAVRTEVQYLQNEFGLTLIQATRINDALNDLAAANGPEQLAAAAMSLGDELARATQEGAQLSPELLAVQKDAYQASLSAAEFARLTGAAIEPANALATAVSGVADEYERAAAFAASLTARYPSRGSYEGVDRSADGNIQNGGFTLPEAGPLPTGRGTPELSGFPWEEIGKKSRGGRSAASKAERERKAVADLISELEEELRLVGATETAKRSAAAIRQAGAAATDNEKEAISSLIAQIDAEEEARDRLIDQMDEYKNITGSVLDDIRSAMDDGKITWGEWADIAINALDKVINRIQDDLLDALFDVNSAASGGGGGGFLGSLFGGLFGGGFAALPAVGPVPTPRPSFDGGGYTGSGARVGGLDGKGGFMALLHPQETVIDHTKTGAANQNVGGRSVVELRLTDGLEARILEQAGNQTVSIVRQTEEAKMNRYQNGGER